MFIFTGLCTDIGIKAGFSDEREFTVVLDDLSLIRYISNNINIDKSIWVVTTTTIKLPFEVKGARACPTVTPRT